MTTIIYWLTLDPPKLLDRRQRQQGWEYLVKSGQRYAQLRLKKCRVGANVWPTPFTEVLFEGWKMKAMGSSLDLVEEGFRMRNCIGMRTTQCSSGKEMLVSVASATGKRIAAAEYAIADGRWKLTSAKGPMNRELDANLKRRLAAFACRIATLTDGVPAAQDNAIVRGGIVIEPDASKPA